MGAQKKKLICQVVLDTNVVLSALLFSRGNFSWLRIAWQTQAIQPWVCHATASELMLALAYPKFKLSRQEQEELLADYLPFCQTFTLPKPPPKVPSCRDQKDLPFLWLAVAAKTDFLISGDKDLQVLAKHFKPPILTIQAFREYYETHTQKK